MAGTTLRPRAPHFENRRQLESSIWGVSPGPASVSHQVHPARGHDGLQNTPDRLLKP